MPDAPTVVCFDLGGVIVRICRSWEEGVAAAGLDLRSAEVTPNSIDAKTDLVRGITDGSLPLEEFFAALSSGVGGLYTPDEFRAVHMSWILGEYDGVGSVVDDLNAVEGVRTACLSNTNALHWEQLGGGAFPAFDALAHRHASHLLNSAKPDPAIYAEFEARLGASGADILFFDDLPENIETALARGWRAVRVDHESETAPQIRTALREHGVLAQAETP